MNLKTYLSFITVALISANVSAQEQKIFSNQTPAQLNLNDGVSYELGMRFVSSSAGKIKAIRFFKASRESGTHTGKIYSARGVLLAQVTFRNETASGWQQQALSSAVQIAANSEYTVSVNTGNRYYAATTSGLASQVSSKNLRSVVGANGVYGAVGARPTKSYRNSNYFRDVVFEATVAPTPTPTPKPSPTPSPTPVPTPKPSPSPTPVPTPTPTPPPSTGYPNASNTGIPAGVVLKSSGSMTVSQDGAVIDAMDISGGLVINANNVTLKRSRVRGNGAFLAVRVMDGKSNVRIEDCEIISTPAGQALAVWSTLKTTIVRNNLSGGGDIVDITGTKDVVVQDNYMHTMSGNSDSHYDAIQADGNISNAVIRHNTIINQFSQTSAIMIDNYWGGSDGILVENNRLIGGGYTVYAADNFRAEPLKNIKFINNRMGKGGYGYKATYTTNPVWSGNVDDVTGKLIP